jgi:tetratricopeptide (TPR) repeat protein
VVEAHLSGLSSQGAKPSASALLRETREQLELAENLRRAGKTDAAITVLETLAARFPDYVGALQTLGILHLDKRNYPRALMCLISAAMLNPRSWLILTALGRVYLRLGAREMAAMALEQATRLKSDDASIFVTLGDIYREEREYELAAEAYRKALAVEPTLKPAIFGLARTCAYLGDHKDAAKAYERLVKKGDRSIGVLWGLARLPPSFVKLNLVSLLNKVKSDREEDFDNHLAFARAQIFDRAGRHEEAWELLTGANRTLYLKHKESADQTSATQRECLAELRAKSWKARGGKPGTGSKAISLFIFGPSRSGKTSLEKLVGVLPGVKRGYENHIASNAVRRTFHMAGFLNVGDYRLLPPQLEPLAREIYEEELERRAGSARVFTNTGPGHARDAARMAAVLPNIRYVFVKRDPDDVALRIFQTRYQKGNYYAYDLQTIRDHIAWYYEMIDGLAEMFPAISRVIHYEHMVADPEGALRQVSELCGLEIPDGPIPAIGDDRGCASPYRARMTAAITA